MALPSVPSISVPSFSAPSLSSPSLSSPISDAHQQRIKDEAADILEQFGKVYLRTYKQNLIGKVKSDLAGEETTDFKLRHRPTEKGKNEPIILQSGWLTKRGALIKSWKRRWFVIRSNGSCDYYSQPDDPKPRGSVVLDGYHVNASSSSDVIQGKQFAFVCEPFSDSRRTWYLMADSEEEKATWVAAFARATWVAEGYVNPDHVAGKSFKQAYKRLRSWYGMWYKHPRGPEEEMLGELVNERLDQAVVRDLLRDLKLSGSALVMAQKVIKGLIKPLVAAAWKGMDQSVARIRPSIEEGLKKILGPLSEAEAKVKDQIQQKVGEKLLNPPVSKVFSPFFAQTVGILYPVLVEAFGAQVEISADHVLAAVSDVIAAAGNPQAAFQALEKKLEVKGATKLLPHKRMEAWTSNSQMVLKVTGDIEDFGGLVPKMRSFINDTLIPAVHLVYPPSLEEAMLQMATDTVYTFEVDFAESSDAERAAKGALAKLEHDLKLHLTETAQESLKTFVRGPFDSFVSEPAKELLAPISEAIPQDLKDFIDPEALLDEILDQTLTDAVNSSAGSGIAALHASLDEILQKKGVSPL